MAAYGIGPAGITTITPPARNVLTKVAKVEVADGAVGFAAFGIPKDAFISGVAILSMGANATQTINVGFTAGGVELVNAYAPNSTGYSTPGAQTGASVGTQLTSDKVVYAKASVTLTSPVFVMVEYWTPPQGLVF